jgi:hypothetical protein
MSGLRLCGLVVRVPGYRSRGSEFNYQRYQIFSVVVGLKRDELSLVRINEELCEIKIYKTEINGRGEPRARHPPRSNRKSRPYFAGRWGGGVEINRYISLAH